MGPGAHSYLDEERFWNIKSPVEYVRRLSGPNHGGDAMPHIEERHRLTEAELLSETLILNLRLDGGVEPRLLAEAFGQGPVLRHLESLRQFVAPGPIFVPTVLIHRMF